MEFKRGDTFILSGAVTDDADVAIPITDWVIRCQIRDKRDNLIATATVTVLDALAGTYKLTVADTTTWPTDTLYGDVEYTTVSGQIISTADFTVTVIKDRTLPVTP